MNKQTLYDIFEYKDGELYWKIFTGKSKVGKMAGVVNSIGYKITTIQGKIYSNHRLIFLMHNGFFPEYVDHINGIKHDNRIENLREATASENSLNQKLSITNSSGIKNVHWHKLAKKWIVNIQVNGKRKNFGSYNDIDYAKFIADAMRYKYHKEFENNG